MNVPDKLGSSAVTLLVTDICVRADTHVINSVSVALVSLFKHIAALHFDDSITSKLQILLLFQLTLT